jgi:hypothetical protein
MKLLIQTVLFVVFCWAGAIIHAQEKCAVDQMHEHLMRTDPAYKQQLLEIQHEVQQIISNMPKREGGAALGENEIYTIPVVVHIIHLGEAVGSGNNVSDAQVLGAINGLNHRFRNVIGNGLDMEIEFCLATRDPDGCYTNGINRVDGSGVENYAARGIMRPGDDCNGASDVAIKNLSRWPVSRYYNIWVTRAICGGWAGYAYYPNGGAYDGTVIARNYFNYNNSTLAHEVGHGLFLYHTFEGDGDGSNCPTNTNCATNGDRVCDTPPHKRNDCGSSNPCLGGGTWTNSSRNYMSYCFTKDRFTPDQKSRMRATLQVLPRAALLNSQGCTSSQFNTVVSTTDISCFSSCNGMIDVTPGCSGSYSYLWNTGDTTATISGLCPGDYNVTIKHSSGHAIDFNASVSEPPVLSASLFSKTDASCYGTSDGSATITVSGGTGTYIIFWSNGQSGPTASRLAAGDYSASVTDARGCLQNVDVTIQEPVAPVQPAITVNGSLTFCPGDSVSLSSSPANGYLWSNNATNQTTTIYAAGPVTVTTFDAGDCQAISDPVLVTHLPAPAIPVISSTGNILTSSSATDNQWYHNGLPIPGAIGQTHTVTESGNYTVAVTGTQCTSLSAPFFLSLSSAGNFLSGDHISISPNPGQGIYSLDAGNLQMEFIFIYNMLGEQVYRAKGNRSVIDISDKPAGNYYLLIHTKEGIYRKKLIVQ